MKNNLNLYLLSHDKNLYDNYDGFVIAAKSEKEALQMCPDASQGNWVEPEDVKIKYLGKACKTISKGEILSSFRAG